MTDNRLTSWKTRLLNLQRGDDSGLDLEHIGGVEQYVRAQITRSDEPANEQLAVMDALEFVFRSMSLRALNDTGLSYMLDLAGTLKPDNAIPALLGFLREYTGHPRERQIGRRSVDLRYRALQVLETYFPAPPLSESAAFAAYRRVLESYLHVSPFRGYVAARFSELDGDVFANAMINEIIAAAEPAELADLLRRVIHHNADPIAQKYLATIFHGLEPDSETRFTQALELLGGALKPVGSGAAIIYYPGREPLTLQSDLAIAAAAAKLEGNKQQFGIELRRVAGNA